VAGRVDELRKRLEAQPESRLFAQLAEELRKEGRLDEAVRVCREGLRHHPAYPSAHMTLGRAFFDKRELAAARTEFEAVLAAAPDNILAGRLLGECLEGLGDPGAARQRYETTLLLAPDDPQLVARLGGLPPASGKRDSSNPRAVAPEGLRRAAAQSVVAAAVASIRGLDAPGRPKGPAEGGTSPPAGGPAHPQQDREGEVVEPAGVRSGTDGPGQGRGPRESGGRSSGGVQTGTGSASGRSAGQSPSGSPGPAGAAADTGIQVGGAAAPSEDGSGSDSEGAGTLPFARGPGEGRSTPGESRPATSRTLPYGTPAPRLPQPGRPGPGAPGSGGQRRAETRPVSVESIKRALEEGALRPPPEREPARSPDGELATATLAELYLKQGHPDKAAEVYRALLERDPISTDIRGRLDAIERGRSERSTRRAALERGIVRLERLLKVVQGARRA
jgi:tetratricopeptide (TPR) repeat protein